MFLGSGFLVEGSSMVTLSVEASTATFVLQLNKFSQKRQALNTSSFVWKKELTELEKIPLNPFNITLIGLMVSFLEVTHVHEITFLLPSTW